MTCGARWYSASSSLKRCGHGLDAQLVGLALLVARELGIGQARAQPTEQRGRAAGVAPAAGLTQVHRGTDQRADEGDHGGAAVAVARVIRLQVPQLMADDAGQHGLVIARQPEHRQVDGDQRLPVAKGGGCIG